MCDKALCNAMALCSHCFDEASKAGDSKTRKKTGGRKRALFLSPEDKLKHDNKIKRESSRRKRAQAKADNATVLQLQHECGKLRQESDAQCSILELHSAEIRRLNQEITQIKEYHKKYETVLREARAHAIRWMEANYGKVSLLSLMYML